VHLVQQQERDQHGRAHLQPWVAAFASRPQRADAQRYQPGERHQYRHQPVELGTLEVRQPPEPDRVRGQVGLPQGLEGVRRPPPARVDRGDRQVQREPGPARAGDNTDRAAPVAGSQAFQCQRQDEEAGVELECRADPEQGRGQPGPSRRPRRDRTDHRRDHEQVPIVKGVEGEPGCQGPQQGAGAGQPGQQPGGEQPERREQQRRHPQVAGHVHHRQAGQPGEDPGEHRVLDRAADELAVDQCPVDVGEDVLGDTADREQVLQVVVAGGAKLPAVPRRTLARALHQVAGQQQHGGQAGDGCSPRTHSAYGKGRHERQR